MIRGQKVVVVLPAYNAERTLERTYREIPLDIVDSVLLTDDASADQTVAVARRLGIETIVHERNRGYGGNQKTCYRAALDGGADIVVMLHADYQYTPVLIPAMAHLLASGEFDVVLGSRILGGQAIRGGMPVYKYVSNRVLTLLQNLLMGAKLSDTTPGTAPSRGRCSRRCRSRGTRTTSCSTPRCCRRSSTPGSASER